MGQGNPAEELWKGLAQEGEDRALAVGLEFGPEFSELFEDCLRYLVAAKARVVAQRKLRGL